MEEDLFGLHLPEETQLSLSSSSDTETDGISYESDPTYTSRFDFIDFSSTSRYSEESFDDSSGTSSTTSSSGAPGGVSQQPNQYPNEITIMSKQWKTLVTLIGSLLSVFIVRLLVTSWIVCSTFNGFMPFFLKSVNPHFCFYQYHKLPLYPTTMFVLMIFVLFPSR